MQQHFEHQAVPLRRDLAEMVLCQMQDVHWSVENLRAQHISDDVELFPDQTAPLELLDPQARRIPEFFIYDEYSPELTAARRTLINLQQ